MPFRWCFWKRKDKGKTRGVDSGPSGVPTFANSSALASTKPTDEPSLRQQAKMIEEEKGEKRERRANNLDATLSSSSVISVLRPQDGVSTMMSVPDNSSPPSGHATVKMFTSASDVPISESGGNFVAIGSQKRDVDSDPSHVHMISNSASRDPTDEPAPRQPATTIEEGKEEKRERRADNLDSALSDSSILDNGVVHNASRERVHEPQNQPETSLLPPGHVPVQMFTSASNFAILGGNFIGSQTIVHGPDDEARLKIIYDMAAPNAILNAGGRADEVRCHPGTREEILAKSEAWMDPPAGQEFNISRKGIFWLSGPAGAGKSAIMQTLAERRLDSDLPMANFFFFRNDVTRSNAHPLVATILVQLFKKYPALKLLSAAVLADNPLIIRQSLRDQFQYLIDAPVRALRDSSSIQVPVVLLIDGLDECSSYAKHEQQSLLKVLHDLASRNNSPFLVYVASRAEPHLIMTFNQVGSSAGSIFLSEDYYPEDDIRLFVTERLAEIKTSHHLGPRLAQSWPTNAQIRDIVNKSSGQFIYAATVIRFISGSSTSPGFSLDIVHSLRPVSRTSPFAELDALYTYILSQVGDWESAKDVLTAHILQEKSRYLFTLYDGLRPLGYEDDDVPSFVSDLPALVKLEDSGNLEFYHASFTDFLCDNTRSGDYYIDVQQFCETWAPDFVRCIRDDDSLEACEEIINRISEPSLSMTEALLSFPTTQAQFSADSCVYSVHFMGKTLHNYCRKDNLLYKKLVRLWIAWFRKNGTIFQELDANIPYSHELQVIKAELDSEVWEEIIRSSNDQIGRRMRG